MTHPFRNTAISPPPDGDGPDVDLPASEEALSDAPSPPGRPLPSAETALVRAAFDAAVTKAQRARIVAGVRLAVVIRVPDPSWVKATETFFMAQFGSGWSPFARDGSQRIRDKAAVGNEEVTAVLTRGRCAVGIAASTDILPAALTAVADVMVRIRPPDAKVLRRALGLFCDTPARLAIPDGLCAGLDFHAIACCFRRGSAPAEVVQRLRTASHKRTGASGEALPKLENAIEYGAFRTFGLELVRDFADLRAGAPWSSLSRGVVVHGESGVGKTLGIRMLAQACGVPLIATSIGQLFADSAGDLGGVVSRWRATLAMAVAASPAILLLDEVDGLPSRSGLSKRNSDFWQPVIADFLTTLDGAMSSLRDGGANSDAREGIVVAATTNHIEAVDPALLRPGRLERVIELRRPDRAGIANILRYHVNGSLTEDEIGQVSHLIEGATPAEIMKAVRDARRIARAAERPLRLGDLHSVLAPTVDMPLDRLFRIAIHECGHAVAALAIGWGTVRSIVIVDHGGALARTVIEPGADDLLTRSTVEARVTMLLSGRAAERIYLKEPGIGSGGDDPSDLATATRLISGLHVSSGLGQSLSYLAPYSDSLSVLRTDHRLRRGVEGDLRRLENRALSIVRSNRPALLAMAERLMERRHLTGDEAREIFAACGTPVESSKLHHIKRPANARSYH